MDLEALKRQAAALDRGERIVQETRLWDAERGVTQEIAHYIDSVIFPKADMFA